MSRDSPDLLADDPVLAPLVERHGRLGVEPAEDPFRRLVTAIVNQQLSTTAAATIRERLFERFEITPTALLGSEPSELRGVGLSARKVEYVRGVAEAFASGDLAPSALEALSDEEVLAQLTELRGIGTWTGKIFLMFGLGRKDVFPVEDLGIRKGMRALFGELSREEMVSRAERWRPHRSRASLYVWRAKREAAGEG